MELLGDVGHVESRFFLFGDSVSVSARLVHGCARCTIGSEIVLEAPDGTTSDEPQVEARFRSVWR